MPMEQNNFNSLESHEIQPYAQFQIDNIFSFFQQFRAHFLLDYFFYRGQANAAWDLESSYERSKRIKKNNLVPSQDFDNNCDRVLFQGELAAINYYLALNDSLRKTRHPKIEVLSEMQHYGASTRLLDITESFGVALFFAITENYDKEDSAIWAINKLVLFTCFIHAEKKIFEGKKGYYAFNPRAKKKIPLIDDLLFESLSGIETGVNEQLCDYAEYLIGNEDVINPPDNNQYCTVYPGVFPVRPTIFNNRLHAQNGLFLLQQSLEHSFKENLLNTLDISLSEFENTVSSSKTPNISEDEYDLKLMNTALIKFIIPYSIKKDCMSILKAMNINFKSLFPDKYGIIKTAERKYFPEV